MLQRCKSCFLQLTKHPFRAGMSCLLEQELKFGKSFFCQNNGDRFARIGGGKEISKGGASQRLGQGCVETECSPTLLVANKINNSVANARGNKRREVVDRIGSGIDNAGDDNA